MTARVAYCLAPGRQRSALGRLSNYTLVTQSIGDKRVQFVGDTAGRSETSAFAASHHCAYGAEMSEWTQLVDGVNFGEGPRWHDGELWYSDFYQQTIYRVSTAGQLAPIEASHERT